MAFWIRPVKSISTIFATLFFDDERLENIYLIDKKNLMRNKVQIIQQFEQTGSHANRYDVTIPVNGLPLVQIELKKTRGGDS